VDRAGLLARRLLDHGASLDQQQPAFHQALGNGASRPGENSSVGLPGHCHPLGGGGLVKTLEVGETDGLELIEADADRLGSADRSSNRPEASARQLMTDTTENQRAWHRI
jgi:hypothetical protein